MKLKLILLPLAALAIGGIATAGTPADTPSVVVKYGDLNLASQAGIARLHKRISNAAESVCGQLESRIFGLQAAYRECVAEAIEKGIATVDNANLSQFHAGKARHAVLAANRH